MGHYSYPIIGKISMLLAAGGAPVAAKCSAVNRPKKKKLSVLSSHIGLYFEAVFSI
jgi:hypothetical protein